MKKCFYLIVIIIISSNLYSQNQLISEKDKVYSTQNSILLTKCTLKSLKLFSTYFGDEFYYPVWDEKERKIHEDIVKIKDADTTLQKRSWVYLPNDELGQFTFEYWNGYRWIITDKDEYTYDDNGRVVAHIEKECNSWDSVLKTSYGFYYTYDENGRMIEEVRTIGSEETNYYRTTWEFDENGNDTSLKRYSWSTDKWFMTDREHREYSSKNECILDESWNFLNDKWQPRYIIKREFDNEGKLSTYAYKHWAFEDGHLESDYIKFYNYDERNNIISILMKQHVEEDIYQEYNRTDYTYDSKDSVLSEEIMKFVNNKWINNRNEYFTYDANGNLLFNLIEYWDDKYVLTKWRYTMSYDSQNRKLSQLNETYKTSWMNNRRFTYVFDEHGNRIFYIREDWKDGEKILENRYTYQYDENNNLLIQFFEAEEEGEKPRKKRNTYAYDEFNNLLSIDFEYFRDNVWNIGGGYFDFPGYSFGHYGERQESEWNYVVSVDDDKQNNINNLVECYPNPFSESTNFKFNLDKSANVNLTIYNSLGQEIAVLCNEWKAAGEHEINFNASNLNSGIYYYKFSVGSENHFGKVVLIR
ncbi:MAG: T9SS type A sorting domain-containing protein [bacterium]